MPAEFHQLECDCEACSDPHPAERASPRDWLAIAGFLALFWLFPGRWLLAAAWHALRPFLPF